MSRTEQKSRASELSNRRPLEGGGSGVGVTVLFTNVPETLAAVRQAAWLAYQLDLSVRILVPQVVPYPLPLDSPRVAPQFRMRQFHTLWEREAVATRIDVRLCRDARRCIHEALAPNSLVVMGEGKGWWPFTREKNLARSLRRAGHQVIPVVGP